MARATPLLDYAPAPPARPRQWRRSVRFWAPAAALVLTLLLRPIWSPWASEGLYRLEVEYWEWRCLTYAPPPDQVVYEDDPVRVAQLLSDPDEYERPIRYGWPAPNVALRRVHCVERYHELTRRAGTNRYAYRDTPIVFLGRRRPADGPARVVRVEYFYPQYIPDDDNPPALRVRVEHPDEVLGGWGGGSISFRLAHANGPLDETRRVRMFAGQADPHDASRFVIRYEVDGEPGTFAVELGPGRHVFLRVTGPIRLASDPRRGGGGGGG